MPGSPIGQQQDGPRRFCGSGSEMLRKGALGLLLLEAAGFSFFATFSSTAGAGAASGGVERAGADGVGWCFSVSPTGAASACFAGCTGVAVCAAAEEVAAGASAFSAVLGLALRRMGDGRAGNPKRCAFPTTAFLVMERRLPISAVERPSAHNALSWAIISSVHSIYGHLTINIASFAGKIPRFQSRIYYGDARFISRRKPARQVAL